MKRFGTTTLEGPQSTSHGAASEDIVPALVVIWAANELRLGEVLLVPPTPAWWGREGLAPDALTLVRQRPGRNDPTEPIENPFLSRNHLSIEDVDDGVELVCAGRRRLLVDGAEFTNYTLRFGQVFEIKGLYSFLLVRRPRVFPAMETPIGTFGVADAFGLVGESPHAWLMRERIMFVARREAHVLIMGPSGTGKELVAQGIHLGSSRGRKVMVSRNAATLPSGLIDAELFGNLASYPNSGMPERKGLVGEADGSTLFLDEVGELSPDLQAHLLRVLDSGEYHRLGESKKRRADFRLIAATNRPLSDLKPDVAARLGLRIELPPLQDRAEDIPLLARHILVRIASNDVQIGERFFEGWNGETGEPRFSAELMRALVQHDYKTHLRELEAILWTAIETSRPGTLSLTAQVQGRIRERSPSRAHVEPSADEVRAALVRHDNVKERVWRELGLPSRHALNRLMKRLGIESDDG